MSANDDDDDITDNDDNHMFVGEGEAVRIDNGMNEPVQTVQHLLITQHRVNGPESCGWRYPLSSMNT